MLCGAGACRRRQAERRWSASSNRFHGLATAGPNPGEAQAAAQGIGKAARDSKAQERMTAVDQTKKLVAGWTRSSPRMAIRSAATGTLTYDIDAQASARACGAA